MTRRIVVADDSATIQKVIKIAFSRLQYEIIEAISFVQAANLLASGAPDLVILDASLPGLQGPAGVSKLIGHHRVPVLLLIGSYDVVDENAYRLAGFSSFLKKPFESTDIVNQVENLLMPLPVLDKVSNQSPPRGSAGEPKRSSPPPPPPQFYDQSVTRSPERTPVDLSFSLEDESLAAGSEGSRDSMSAKTFSSSSSLPSTVPSQLFKMTNEIKDFVPQFTSASTHLVAPLQNDAPQAPVRPTLRPRMAAGSQQDDVAPGFSSPPAFPHPSSSPSSPPSFPSQISQREEEMMRAAVETRLADLVSLAVREYCEQHFRSLAREFIAIELRRLADEKARYLVDN